MLQSPLPQSVRCSEWALADRFWILDFGFWILDYILASQQHCTTVESLPLEQKVCFARSLLLVHQLPKLGRIKVQQFARRQNLLLAQIV